MASIRSVQIEAYLEDGFNVFLTGSQGTGKTRLTCEIVERMVAKKWRVLCTASTGVAAQHLKIDGVTLSTVHKAWAFGSHAIDSLNEHEKDGDVEAFMAAYEKKWKSVRAEFRKQLSAEDLTVADLSGPKALVDKFNLRGGTPPSFLASDLVVIDEVSMMSAFVLRVLDRVARWWMGEGGARSTGDDGAAFGGLRVVFVGDLQQLPPIERHRDRNREVDADFFFEAPEWRDGTWVQRKVLLTHNWRQAADPAYAATLERMANNALTEEDERLFAGAVLDGGFAAATDPSVLPGVLRVFNTRQLCREFADRVLNSVYQSGQQVFPLKRRESWSIPKAEAEAAYGREQIRHLWNEHVRKVDSELCVEVFQGCPVFLRQNLDVSAGLVNGLRGCVVMLDEEGDPIVDFENDVGEFAVERVAKSVYLDDYPMHRRAAIERGDEAEDVGRPLVKADYEVHALSTGFATTPWCVQGKTLDALLYDPPVGYRDRWVPSEAFYVVASRIGVFGDNRQKRGPLRKADGEGSAVCRDPGLAIVSDSLMHDPGDDGTNEESGAGAIDLNNVKGLFLTRFRPQRVYVRPKVIEYLQSLKREQESDSKTAAGLGPLQQTGSPKETAREKRGKTKEEDKRKENAAKKAKTTDPRSSSLSSIETEPRLEEATRSVQRDDDDGDDDEPTRRSPSPSSRPDIREWNRKETTGAHGVEEHSARSFSTSTDNECTSRVAIPDKPPSIEKRSLTPD